MDKNAREFYRVDASMTAFNNVKAKFNSFPLPTENTILAAEVLRRCLMETDAPAAGAVAVVELRGASRLTFITVASGGGLISDTAVSAWETTLKPLLEGSFQSVQCTALNSAAIFYSPAHMDTVAFIKGAFDNFGLPAMPLDAQDFKTATDAVTALPTGEFGMNYQNGQQLGNLNPTVTAIHQLLAVAVAMRINAYKRSDVSGFRATLEQFKDKQKTHFPYAGREELIENIEALALQGGNPNQYAYRENPGKPISQMKKIQGKLDDAWRVADLNRFCAEPKAFTYLKSHGVKDLVAGQLAMWWDTSRPNRYGFPGSEASPYSDYMLPCTSCQARSAEMMSNVMQTHLTMLEEPIGRVSDPIKLPPRAATV